MLRSFLIYLSKAAWARNLVMGWSFAWRAASRFIAGEKLEDALQVVRNLNQKGINATLDHLGEHTTNPEEARNATQAIMDILEGIAASGVRSNVSIKLTQIGLALDETMCRENLIRLLEKARAVGNFIRMDIEDSPWVDATLRLYRQVRFEYNFDNIGLAIQAYLYRSEADIRQLSQECARVRLCKGAYKEPPDIAFPRKADVDRNYDLLARILLDTARSSGCPAISQNGYVPPIPALATHDEKRIQNAKAYAHQIGLPKPALEFQFLHGIRRDLQEQLAHEGYPVRVYVPFGTQWYPYFMRRLAERPANVWFFVSNFFRR